MASSNLTALYWISCLRSCLHSPRRKQLEAREGGSPMVRMSLKSNMNH